MAEEELNIILRAIDQASKVLKGVSSSAEELSDELEEVDGIDPVISVDDDQVEEATSELEALDEQQVSDKVVPVDDDQAEEANAELEALDEQQISQKVVPVDDDQIEEASAGLDGLNSKLLGVAGTIGLVDQATKLWEASTQRQTTQFYLGANLGEKKAREMQLAIQDIVATVPGDDTFMNTVLSGAMAKQTNLTTAELTKGAQAMADYIAGSEMQGKNAIEAQQDLKSYILSGSTAELQRSSILSNQVDILENKSTIQERINALIEAENNEQVAGLSGYDTAANKLTEFQGRIEKAQADLGELFLPAIQGALEFGLALDDSLGGGLMASIAGLGAAIPAIATGLSMVGQSANGINALITGFGKLRDVLSLTAIQEQLLNAVEGEGAIARFASALGITTEAAAAEGATVAFGGLAIAEGAALWPILAIIAAIAALGVAVYELGKYFGWWTDVGSMLEAINAGVQRLWSAFINHPDVQAIISAISNAWRVLSSAVGSAINWVLKFFNVNTGGEFDVVRALIEMIGLAWKALTLPIRTVINVIKNLITVFKQASNSGKQNVDKIRALFRALPGAIRSAISSLVSIITTPFRNAYNGVKSAVDRIKNAAKGITNINISSVTSKLTSPFTNAYNRIKGIVSNIISKARSIPSNIPGIGGAFGFDYEGMLEEINSKNNNITYTNTDETLTLDHNINFTFDFNNLPEGTSEETLVAMLRSAITDRSVINSLVNSPDFQSLDGKVKDRLVLKNGRARGV